jgi:hypothetical protein
VQDQWFSGDRQQHFARQTDRRIPCRDDRDYIFKGIVPV